MTAARTSEVAQDDTARLGRTRMWRLRSYVNRYVNPITRPVAKRLPTFAILTHQGRKSGRTYRTPINVFRRGDHYFFFLTYGSDVQWVRNVLATGSLLDRNTRSGHRTRRAGADHRSRTPPSTAARPARRAADRWGEPVPPDASFRIGMTQWF
jgi:deazaflavin-dependent oxidoreductase (nitroreductase family)